MDENAFYYVIDYLNSLEDSVSFKTDRYIGFKIRGKIYAQVTEKFDYISVLIRRRYISDDELTTLQVSLSNFGVWKNYAELRVPKTDEYRLYMEILHKAYLETREEYDSKVQYLIEDALLCNESMASEFLSSSEYVYKRLNDYFEIVFSYNISNVDLINIKSNLILQESYSYDNIVKGYFYNNDLYEFMLSIYNLIVFIYRNILNIDFITCSDDKKILELSIIKEHKIIESIVNYKLYRDISLVSDFTRNLMLYLNNPFEYIPIFDEQLLYKFAIYVNPDKDIKLDYSVLCKYIYKYLSFLELNSTKEENIGIVYSKILLSDSITATFYSTNYYWKLQPYLESDLTIEDIQYNLENNIIVSKDKALIKKSTSNNIFYAVKDEMPLFLGLFIGEVEVLENDFYLRRFKVINASSKSNFILPEDKYWGSKATIKSVISVGWEDIEYYEQSIIMNIYGFDSESLLNVINEIYDTSLQKHNVLETYYNDETDIPNNIIFTGPSKTSKSYHAMKYSIAIIENISYKDIQSEINAFDNESNYKYKSYLSQKRIKCIYGHSNYNYKDFMGEINGTGNLNTLGLLKEMVYRATVNPNKNFVLIIEDINKLNISNTFGEALKLLNTEKRLSNKNEVLVTLSSNEIFGIPRNLYIIGTYSSAVGEDFRLFPELKYSFNIIYVTPQYQLIPLFSKMLMEINKILYQKFNSINYLIGQGDFMNKNINDLGMIIEDKLMPILNDYFQGDNNAIIEIFREVGVEVSLDISSYGLKYIGLINKAE